MNSKHEQVVAEPTITIRQALQRLDENSRRILMLVTDRKLLGVVTDGDIRRWILGSGDLAAPVITVANKRPIVLYDGEYALEDARAMMLQSRAEALPVVNREFELVSIIYWFDVEGGIVEPQQRFNLPVVIMAGGLGSRLAPYTQVLPKPLIPIGDKTVVERIIDRFVPYGCSEFFLSVNYHANMIRAYFGETTHDYHVNFLQEDEPRGTIGSLALARKHLATTFFVTNCDIIVTTDYDALLRFHREKGFHLTTVAATKNFAIPYGVLETDGQGELREVREKPSNDFLVNTGLYLIEPGVLDLIPAQGIFHVTDLMEACLSRKMRVGVYPVSERAWLDMGQVDEMKRMVEYFRDGGH